jgi:NAD(P)-dependent dehydrogenase (short-subunit alcohol dehydrogenase family)
MRLKDKVALVTGGSGGIGQAICAALAREGAAIALHYHKRQEAALAAAAQIGAAGQRAELFQADVAEAEEARILVDRVVDRLGRLDILVNNAGITLGGGPVIDTSIEQWKRVMDVNLNSVFYVTRAALPHMRRQQCGQIVNISSNAVNSLPGGSAAYATSKSGVVALTKVLSKEEARNGIRVNSICPGMINAGMGVGALERRGPELAQQFLNTIPLGRAGTAEEVAPTVVFLCSDEASYITGQNFNVNGGDRTESYQ